MSTPITRRRFVGATLAGLGGLELLHALPSADAAAGPALPQKVAVASELEPLVKLIEETPRQQVVGKVIDHIRDGTSYQELLGALFLAGVRGIQPRPVGFKFHAVLVVNSAHLASLAARDNERWLPLLWSVDYFKGAQERNAKEGDWRMKPADEAKLPSADDAAKEFTAAMDAWDEERADRAIVALGRAEGAAEVFEQFWIYGARDFRDIGHKAIYAANAWRTLNTIGWRHQEPVLRSLAYGQLDHRGGNPAKRDDPADRPGRANMPRAGKLTKFRHAGKRDEAATKDVLAALRTEGAEDISKQVFELINKGIHPASLWDGVFLGAGELLMRQPGIYGLHCLTTVNALHFGYQTSARPTTRAFLLLQAAAFMAMFRGVMTEANRRLSELRIDTLEAAEAPKGGVAEVLADLSKDRTTAAKKALGLLREKPAAARGLIESARALIFAKGTDSHDYKFSSAVMEDAYHLAAPLRPAFLAASLYNLKGSGERDNDLIKRTRAALAKG